MARMKLLSNLGGGGGELTVKPFRKDTGVKKRESYKKEQLRNILKK